ncbi:MAG: S-layer homology domain-containing protein, partial [Bacillota bacterium]|nr:S-layer homology domain-containing protein [Bacillota bacterium]
ILGYTDGTFRPDQLITRAEAMTMVNRVLQRVPESPSDLLSNMITWSDNMDTAKWYYLAVQEATNSHDYTRKTNGYETWTQLRDVRDWNELEK